MWNWDEDKRQTNLAKHGVDFAAVAGFDWATVTIEPDTRFDYGEERFEVRGMIALRLHIMVFTPRAGRFRIISLRKANSREETKWERTRP